MNSECRFPSREFFTLLQHAQDKRSFTLIELLIVIAIVSVLSVVVIVALNPVEILKQGRDSNRLQELRTIDRALGILAASVPQPYLGKSNVVYVSLPDIGATDDPQATDNCSVSMKTALPPLPSPWTYHCAPPDVFRKVNGHGWIPIDFAQMASGPPFSGLPIDPRNNATSRFYYTYATGGGHGLTALLESEGKHDPAIKDGGWSPGVYEVGSNVTLTPATRDMGLVAYWKFDEGSGTVVYDYSGNGNNGGPPGGADAFPPSWATGKVGGALSFDIGNGGTSETVGVVASQSLDNLLGNVPHSLVAWAYPSVVGGGPRRGIVDKGDGGNFGAPGAEGFGMHLASYFVFGRHGSDSIDTRVGFPPPHPPNVWYHVAGVFDGQSTAVIYLDNIKKNVSTAFRVTAASHAALPLYIGKFYDPSASPVTSYFKGLLDEIRIYNRALSAAEIQALYNATQ